ncbi:Phthiocerol/phenolphthiocerol synthesis polyketide synthase type I PpsA [Pirellulimonas nuda]|uniref:Phthiocerol/phenolphthiocerol synthesis polyketide synthase type I PpsA n=1 Tax=Pirellulimonas nuda TaxID=2528009 RepID=A0A518DIB6_9BACT|nr:SDR family NAD(P)-dependent oxidoreductase [Pirellulimonas nuda]QDU91227.1 Phthiocerol/phenolphthiocerol synthesis polyketide synthase type I PpsA [Pirellulimonas nuda]
MDHPRPETAPGLPDQAAPDRAPLLLRQALSLPEVLRTRAGAAPDRLLYRFLPDGEQTGGCATYGDLYAAASRVAGELARRGAQGEPVLLVFPEGIDFVSALFGCFYAGAIATPINPPRKNRKAARLAAVVRDSGARMALVDATTLDLLRPLIDADPLLAALEWVSLDAAAGGDAAEARLPDPHSPAFLQYTSGSTGQPKGVVVSHANLIENQRLIRAAFGQDESIVVAGWLPAFHDMGLVGNLLHPLALGGSLVFMPPLAFLQKPIRWLRAISDYGVTCTGGPDFALDLCVRETTQAERAGLDLSRLQVLFNGAEPVRAATVRAFTEAFAPYGFRPEALCPCYGMAETTLLVSGSRKTATPRVVEVDPQRLALGEFVPTDASDARALVGSGPVDANVRAAIVDPETGRPCGPGQIGEVWLAGPTVAAGYWKNARATEEAFHAVLASDPTLRYLRTGDLGVLHDGELFVTGRLKDLLIVHGANHYPQDIEATAAGAHAAVAGCVGAAITVGEESEGVALVQEVQRQWLRRLPTDEVAAAIVRAVAEEHQLEITRVTFVRPGAVPKTSSGKTQRRATRDLLLVGGLKVVGQWRLGDATSRGAAAPEPDDRTLELEAWLTEQVAERARLGVAEVDRRTPFAQYGLGSLAAVRLSGLLSERLGRTVPPTIAYDYPNIAALARHLVHGDEPAAATPAAGAIDEPLAIIGLGCRFPGAESVEGFWELLAGGASGLGPYPADRWRGEYAGEAPPKGGFLGSVDGFEPEFFGISPREAEWMDPQQRLWLEVVWESLELAGVRPSGLRGSRTGVFAGVSAGDYLAQQARQGAAPSAYGATGASPAVLANRTSYVLDLKGPSWSVDTACSSSLVAVHQAAAAVRRGECDLAIAGGVNLILSEETTTALCRAGMLSPGGETRAFAAGADGFVRGEGCGVVVLKRLSAALADGDRVWAVLRGTAVGQDGRSNGLTAPSGPSQQDVIRQALAASGLKPADIDYIEAHGTGTELGDPTEMGALGAVFGERDRPLAVGSVKTNIGHLEGAAGVAGLIKACLALHHGQQPPTLNFAAPSPHIDWSLPLEVSGELRAWPEEEGRVRRAGVSSFGFGGANAHAVLESAPNKAPGTLSEKVPDTFSWVTLSARTPAALAEQARRWAGAITPATPVAEIAAVAARREVFGHRLAVGASDSAVLREKLLQWLASDRREGGVPADAAPPADIAAWLASGAPLVAGPLPALTLPTYPFERRRYWFPVDPAAGRGAAGPVVHPLLGRGLDLAGGQHVFEVDLARVGWLNDHQVQGAPTLPAAAYIEMAAAAGGLVNASQAWRLVDLKIERRVTPAAGQDARLQTQLTPAGEGWSIAFFSRDAGAWVRSATGRLLQRGEASQRIAAGAAALAPRDVADHYRTCSAYGLDYQNAFRGLRTLHGAAGYAEATLAAAGATPLLDCALQAIAATLSDDQQVAWVPVGAAEAWADLPDGQQSVAARVASRQEGDFLLADVDLLLGERPVGALRGVRLARVAAPQSPYFQLTWAPRLRATEPAWQPPALDLSSAISGARQRGRHALVAARRDALGELERISTLWGAEALAELCGARRVGDAVDHLPVVPANRQRLLERIVAMLREDGWLVADERGLRLARPIVAGEAARALAEAQQGLQAAAPELAVIAACAPRLVDVLLERCEPLELLFPSSGGGAADLYRTSIGAQALNETVADAVEACVARLPAGRSLRVLEIGAGSGATTEGVLRRGWADRLRYTFTDVAPAFLAPAKRRFAGRGLDGDGLSFEVLDIESDPAGQGFAAGGYDVVIAANVLHATADLARSVRHARRLLAPGGVLVLVEGTRPLRWLDLSFGMLDGWWRGEDASLRAGYPLIDESRWAGLLGSEGFAEAACLSLAEPRGGSPENSVIVASIATGAIESTADFGEIDVVALDGTPLLGLENEIARRRGSASVAGVSNPAQGVRTTLFTAMDEAASGEDAQRYTTRVIDAVQRASGADRFVLVTRGAQSAMGGDSPAAAAAWGVLRSLAHERPQAACRRIDLPSATEPDVIAVVDELLSDSTEPEIVLAGGRRLAARLCAAGGVAAEADGARVAEIAQRGSIDGVRLARLPRRPLAAGEVEIAVEAAGLNFRDVLNTLGRYPGEPPLGGECSGSVRAIGAGVSRFLPGDHVIAIAPRTFADRVVAPEEVVALAPATCSLTEAATLPIAMLTASLALEEIGELCPCQRVLIHAATGGVGLAAVQIAAARGAQVYATASRAKHVALLDTPVAAAFDSRSPGFAAGVMASTQGQGVDVVLNALGESFVAENLKALAHGGRYIDLTKPEGDVATQIAALRPDVVYSQVDLAHACEADPAMVSRLLSDIVTRVDAGELKPLPLHPYGLDRLGDAMRAMQRAEHIGKLLVCPGGAGEPAAPPAVIRADGAYVVAGGLGDLGLETARLLAARGAGVIGLVGRSEPTAAQLQAVRAIEADGARVVVALADISDRAQLAAALDEVRAAGAPIRGVVHSAGALADGLIEAQTAETVARVFAAKARGGWLLHELTAGDPVELFVVYSSLAGLLGSPGQSNHAAANAYLDALVAWRRRQGLPGLALQWGPWAGIGEAARRGVEQRTDLAGLDPLSPARGLDAMRRLLTSGVASVLIAPLDVQRMSPTRRAAPVFELLRDQRAEASAAAAPGFLEAYHAAPRFARRGLLATHLKQQLAAVLGMRDAQQIASDAALFELGLDSLTTLELKNALTASLGVETPANLVFDYPTIDRLAEHLAGLMDAAKPQQSLTPPAADEATTPATRSRQPEANPLGPKPPSRRSQPSAQPATELAVASVLQDLAALEDELQSWDAAR